ncbi:aminoacyl-histidine dipeptidase [Reichenbachiella carrageenanivorans]|uniref:Aminoacyl-histidine dipeptidase n=1 Tax=Reichenbachiella carrageenanivorans TaxID=2979869 RepID=A0ABY6D415_9BACT|nr:aminoacyl-histidine dipeptidase [Reichenbachiella carrageenanivorans]UXX80875.1 aminoacyl-histidine dipeptidase [Reichenbachiella carrageenanivorans]
MSEEVRNLEPKALWNCFADLNAVPRPSKKEERVIVFVKNFGESLNLDTYVDEVGNIIIKKPATPGMENRKTVCIQSHIDMVHQKNADTVFDFDTQGIEMYVEGDWVKAKGTTLGADNGIGAASIMALLAATDIAHPALEGLFTIDEETGMTGAMGLKGGLLDASIMLNLDTEDDHELTIGCAGGVDVTGEGRYTEESAIGDRVGLEVTLKGLSGGHSGMQIHEGLGNANKLMNRLLYALDSQFDIRIASIEGGGLRNAIPRESVVVLSVLAEELEELEEEIIGLAEMMIEEHDTTDPEMEVLIEEVDAPTQVMNKDFQFKLLRAVYALPNGIYRMSPDMEGLVQTSNNVARVTAANGKYSMQCLTRSSVDTEKVDLALNIQAIFEWLGATSTMDGDYPGWEPKPEAAIVKLMDELYQKQFGHKADVSACHAGLECGILGTNYPEMEMISFGPNIRGAHSPDECVQISSVQKYWPFLLETLKNIPM